jgi:hypothetical protein
VDEPQPPREAVESVIRLVEHGEHDVAVLGERLWYALTGRAPYDGELPQLEQSGSLSIALNRILRTSLAEDPARRYPSAEAMSADLRRTRRLGDEPVTAVEPVGDPEPQRATGVWLVLVAVVVVAILVAGGILAPHLLDHVHLLGSDASSSASTPTSR